MKEFNGEREEKKPKWKMLINSWLGDRTKTGEWISESVAVKQESTGEFIHIHHGYRPHIEGEKKTRKAFYFRGARIWRPAQIGN